MRCGTRRGSSTPSTSRAPSSKQRWPATIRSLCRSATAGTPQSSAAAPPCSEPPGDDVIVGTAGEDNIYAGAGNDTICGRAGYDTIRPGTGTDWVAGEAGGNAIDYSDADHGVNVDLAAGTGDGDLLRDFDEVFGSVHDDHLLGDGSDNFLAGNTGDDLIEGRGGDDLLWGRSSDAPGPSQTDDDTLLPGAGSDRVLAYEGDDIIEAVDGTRDEIDCGTGRDTATTEYVDVTTDCERPPQPEVSPEVSPPDVCDNLPGAQAVAPAGTYVKSGNCLTVRKVKASLRIARPAWKPLDCGDTWRSRCVVKNEVRILADVAPAAGANQALLRLERKTKGWRPKQRVRVSLGSTQTRRVTRTLRAGRWRMRLEIRPTADALAAQSPWIYLRVRPT